MAISEKAADILIGVVQVDFITWTRKIEQEGVFKGSDLIGLLVDKRDERWRRFLDPLVPEWILRGQFIDDSAEGDVYTCLVPRDVFDQESNPEITSFLQQIRSQELPVLVLADGAKTTFRAYTVKIPFVAQGEIVAA